MLPIASVVHAKGVEAHLNLHWWIIVTLVPLACVTMASLGLLLGTSFEPRNIGLMFGFIILPVTFLGGTYYEWTRLAPIEAGGWHWLQIVVLVNPLIYVNEGMRAALTDAPHMHLYVIYPVLTGFWPSSSGSACATSAAGCSPDGSPGRTPRLGCPWLIPLESFPDRGLRLGRWPGTTGTCWTTARPRPGTGWPPCRRSSIPRPSGTSTTWASGPGGDAGRWGPVDRPWPPGWPTGSGRRARWWPPTSTSRGWGTARAPRSRSCATTWARRAPPGPFDLVHARLVLVHVPQRGRRWPPWSAPSDPGGWLVVEDADPALQPLTCIDEYGPGAGPGQQAAT